MLPYSKASLGPRGGLDGFFAVGGHRRATVAILSEMDDPETDLNFGLPRSGSQTGTFEEPDVTVCKALRFGLPYQTSMVYRR